MAGWNFVTRQLTQKVITKYINVLSKREIFTYFRRLFCYQEAANIILIEAPTANVAIVVPVNINKNVSFILDTSGVDHVDDLKCDEMGCCECVGVRNGHFERKSSKAKKVSERKCHREDVFKSTRCYYSNDSLPSLKKIVDNTPIQIKIAIRVINLN